jgi:hypothetical protein
MSDSDPKHLPDQGSMQTAPAGFLTWSRAVDEGGYGRREHR